MHNTYAQHGEDILVENLLGQYSVNSFIDVGANDGVLFSNTYKFAKKGAAGLCFEPSRGAFNKLCLNHLIHPKVKCFRKAVSNQDGYVSFLDDGYESILSRVQSKYEQNDDCKQVPTITLETIMDKLPNFRNVDLLSVDVEGHEKEVFQGMKNKSLKSKIIIFESDKTKVEDILSLPCLKDYTPCFTNDVNVILLHKSNIGLMDNCIKLPMNYRCY